MIEGQRLRLRAPVEGDLPALVAMRNDVALQTQVMGTPHPNTPAMVRDWMNRHLLDPRAIFFVVARREDDLACGYVMVQGVDPLHGHGDLGICLGRHAQGQGYGGEAMSLLEGYARGVFGLHKLGLRVLASNERALALYRRLGYADIGIMRRHYYADGRHHDVVLMEKLFDTP